MKYIIGVFLLLISWFLITAQAQPDFYYLLISKIGVLSNNKDVVQYANVRHCNKVVSITVNHISEYVDRIKPDAKLLAVNREYDIAIYEILGRAESSPLAKSSPDPFEEVYIPTFVWMNDSVIVYKYPVIGTSTVELLIQGIVFYGASGSGTYNKDGEYIGPVQNMLAGPGFNDDKQQVNISGIGRLDKVIELFNKSICSGSVDSTK